MPTALIILDYDGVIADSLDYCLAHARAVCTAMHHTPLPTRRQWADLEDITWEAIGRRIRIPESRLAAFKSAVYAKMAEDAAAKTPIFGGMAGAIRRLCQNHLLAVITTNAAAVVEAVLAREQLSAHITAVMGADAPGSKSDKIKRLLEIRRIKAHEAALVGDTVSDIRHARRAGVTAVAATWGWQPESVLSGASPDFWVHSPAELERLFRDTGPGKVEGSR